MTSQVPATREPRPQIVAGAPVAALVPQTLEEAFRLAGALAASGMAPRGMEKPEQIMVAIMAGAELGLAPFQSLQSFAVVNGRPTLWGDGLMAVVKARGVKVKEWLEGDGDERIAYCEVTRPDNGEVTLGEFSVADAKKAGLWGKAGPWQQYPKRMLKMRARVALRDGCADMLRGIQIREEVEDYQLARDVTPKPSGLAARLAHKPQAAEGFNPRQAAQDLGVSHDAETGEIVDAEIEDVVGGGDRDEAATTGDGFPGDQPAPQVGETAKVDAAETIKPTIAERFAVFEQRMGAATNSTKLKSIRRAADNLFDDMETSAPEDRVELAFKYEARLEELEAAEKAAAAADAATGGDE